VYDNNPDATSKGMKEVVIESIAAGKRFNLPILNAKGLIYPS
jgi:hypothetical protein